MLDGLDVDPWPVGLVISEAVTNVVLHAYRGGEPGAVRVKAWVEADLVTLVVGDDGIGMSPNPDSPGLGMRQRESSRTGPSRSRFMPRNGGVIGREQVWPGLWILRPHPTLGEYRVCACAGPGKAPFGRCGRPQRFR
jgi:hypothetical protein